MRHQNAVHISKWNFLLQNINIKKFTENLSALLYIVAQTTFMVWWIGERLPSMKVSKNCKSGPSPTNHHHVSPSHINSVKSISRYIFIKSLKYCMCLITSFKRLFVMILLKSKIGKISVINVENIKPYLFHLTVWNFYVHRRLYDIKYISYTQFILNTIFKSCCKYRVKFLSCIIKPRNHNTVYNIFHKIFSFLCSSLPPFKYFLYYSKSHRCSFNTLYPSAKRFAE